MTDDYPSNSMRERDARKPKRKKPNIPIKNPDAKPTPVENKKKDLSKAPKVTTKVRKPSLLSKFQSSIVADGAEDVGSYIFWDVLIPAAKDTIKDIITQGIEMLLYGSTRGNDRGRRSAGNTVISYGSYHSSSKRRRGPERPERTRSSGFRHRLSNIVYDYQEDAGEVLEFLHDLLDEYGSVSVADFYEVSGLAADSEYTDNSWGWFSLERCRVVRTRDGWEITFPEPVRLE